MVALPVSITAEGMVVAASQPLDNPVSCGRLRQLPSEQLTHLAQEVVRIATVSRQLDQLTSVLLRELDDDVRHLGGFLRIEPGPFLQHLDELADDLFLHGAFPSRVESLAASYPRAGDRGMIPQRGLPRVGLGSDRGVPLAEHQQAEGER